MTTQKRLQALLDLDFHVEVYSHPVVRICPSPWKNGERTLTFKAARAYGVRLYYEGDEVYVSAPLRGTLALAMRDAHVWAQTAKGPRRADVSREVPNLPGIAALFASLTSGEREQIASDYCRECWREGNGCQCSNDE